jgi:hypothetical protein
MGATSAQGWYLFLFIVGFTLGPAGLFALGWPVALVGFAILAASFAGFRSIKNPVPPEAQSAERAPAAPLLGARKSH